MTLVKIPEKPRLQAWYDDKTVELLEGLRAHLSGLPAAMVEDTGRAALDAIWPTEAEQIQNTHWIEVKMSRDRAINAAPGARLLRWNYAQQKFYDDVIQPARRKQRPIRSLVLKARQLGKSTFMQSWMYQQLSDNPNQKAATVSYDDKSALELFSKTHFVHENLWFPRPLSRDRNGTIQFAKPHYSLFETITANNWNAGRGWFFAHLHLSEVPMWEHPEETATSILQTVPDEPGTSVVMEFTARGAQGYAYEQWCDAVDGKNDFVPFFAPWFWDPGYTKPFEAEELHDRFATCLSTDHRIPGDVLEMRRTMVRKYGLTLEQMHWWDWCVRNKCRGSENIAHQEFPSCAEEAFLMSGSPVFEDTARLQRLLDGCKPPSRRGHILLTST